MRKLILYFIITLSVLYVNAVIAINWIFVDGYGASSPEEVTKLGLEYLQQGDIEALKNLTSNDPYNQAYNGNVVAPEIKPFVGIKLQNISTQFVPFDEVPTLPSVIVRAEYQDKAGLTKEVKMLLSLQRTFQGWELLLGQPTLSHVMTLLYLQPREQWWYLISVQLAE